MPVWYAAAVFIGSVKLPCILINTTDGDIADAGSSL